MISSLGFLSILLFCTTQPSSYAFSFSTQLTSSKPFVKVTPHNKVWIPTTTTIFSSNNNEETNQGTDSNENSSSSTSSNNDEIEKEPTPYSDLLQQKSESFVDESQVQQTTRLDPLIASLTRIDPATADSPSISVPLLGEFPIDGSVLVLVPAIVIAVLGFIVSIQLAIDTSDDFLKGLEETKSFMSATPMKETVVSEGCRGLCSNQEEQLNSMRGFMEGLRK